MLSEKFHISPSSTYYQLHHTIKINKVQLFVINLQKFVTSVSIITMSNHFVDDKKDFLSIIKQEEQSATSFLFENSEKQIVAIEEFFKGSEKLFYITGFLGTGKKEILDKTLSFLNSDTVILEYTCFETTILDDILLSFFDIFKNLTAIGAIEQPKIKSENFTQKINAYFKTIEKPIVIRVNSLQNILKDNKDEIFGFFNSLLNYPNIKIILSSRKFDNVIDEFNINYAKTTLGAFEKHIFEKYLKFAGYKNIGPISDELYKYTKGYWLYTTLSIKVMNFRGLKLIDFLSGYTKSMLSFNDFIFRELLSLIDPVSGHMFRFLTLMRHPVSINLLKTLNLWDEQRVNFFVENLIIYRLGNLICLPEHYKIIAQNTITENISIKIHRSCVQLYETQIPLKPFERDMLLSRATMRKEIEYHNTFVPQRPKFTREPMTGIQFAVREKPQIEQISEQNIQIQQPPIEQSKNAVKNVSFIFDEEAIDDIAATINDFVESSHQNAVTQEEISDLKLIELLNFAKTAEAEFDYKKVIAICQKALTLNSDDDYYTFLPAIYLKLAQTYKKLSDWFSANKYFELAADFFEAAGANEKAAESKYEIATVCFMTYKVDTAKQIAKEILNTSNLSDNMALKTLLLLIDIAENNTSNQAYVKELFERALTLAQSQIEIPVLSDLFFKWGVFNDNESKLDTAIENYKKCISLSKNPNENPNLAPAYSNIASICKDTGNLDIAIKYAQESLKINEQTGNLNGTYDSALKLAGLFKSKNYDKTIEFYEIAKKAALKLNEPFYIASVNVSLGDFIIHYGKVEEALKLYLQALSVAKEHFKPTNISKIDLRINDIKSKIGEEKFSKISKEAING